MYQIATNACLDALRNRVAVRKLFAHAGASAPSDASIGAPAVNVSWLEPYPDSETEIPDGAIGPEASYERVETVRLAFLAAVQQLAPRQRAVFLLRDVMGWSAEQVAEAIHATPQAANSLLQRARRVFAETHARLDAPPSSTSEQEAIAARYAAAWWARNLDAFVALLCEDAILRMPPFARWFCGRDAIRAFFARVWPSYSAFKVVGLRANGQPACAVYKLEPTAQEWRPHSIHVLDVSQRGISAVTGFVGSLGPTLFPYFDLPMLIDDV